MNRQTLNDACTTPWPARPRCSRAASRLIGDVETPGALIISGHVQGDGRIAGELIGLADAHWEGDVVARSAVVAGRVTGSIS